MKGDVEKSVRPKPTNPSQKIANNLKSLVENCGLKWTQELEDDLPRKWKVFGNLIFLREGSCFSSKSWTQIGLENVWQAVGQALGVSRIAVYRGVKSDEFRSPDLTLVWRSSSLKEESNECWVTKRENGITYSFDAMRSMFSVGNFSEKARLAELVNNQPLIPDGEIAVDMFAGIGYFSLSLLVKCPPSRMKVLHCCEWNPAALAALRRNIVANRIDPERCVIHEGDCRLVAPVGIAQRVFLGLIPSSELAWPAACRALSPQTGGVIHVHSLVNLTPEAVGALGSIDPNDAEANRCAIRLVSLLAICHPSRSWSVTYSHVSNVKFYAPLLRHVVIDVHCIPLS